MSEHDETVPGTGADEAPVPEPLSKEALIASLQVSGMTRLVNGALVQALSDADYLRSRAMRDRAATSAAPDKRQEAYQLAERAAMLSLGVIEPKMSFEEWQHVLTTAGVAQIGGLLDAIKELSGIEDAEVVLAKKLLGGTVAATES